MLFIFDTIQLHIAKVWRVSPAVLSSEEMPLGPSSSVMKSYLCHVDLSLSWSAMLTNRKSGQRKTQNMNVFVVGGRC